MADTTDPLDLLTVRGYIATLVLAGLASTDTPQYQIRTTAKTAVKFADALLAELAKPKEAT